MKEAVRAVYGAVAAKEKKDSEGARTVAKAFGYSDDELSSIPAEANMGLSCGNSIQIANLKEGEVVVDLGSGGGLDCFLASSKVGPKGQVIGIDMTAEMITLAMKNAAKMGAKARNCDFRQGEIEAIPVEDASVDCVISNCVLNLVPDKSKAFKEILRILKPGGRLAASDVALKKPLPEEVKANVMAYIGCISGAILIDDYQNGLEQVGFGDVRIIDSHADLNAYAALGTSNCCAPPSSEVVGTTQSASSCCNNVSTSSSPSSSTSCCSSSASGGVSSTAGSCCSGEGEGSQSSSVEFGDGMVDVLQKININDYAASVKVLAVKP